jgi:hypothetical protein
MHRRRSDGSRACGDPGGGRLKQDSYGAARSRQSLAFQPVPFIRDSAQDGLQECVVFTLRADA